ncbi:MogA/MoaB family molybdenum cofactor biosynthesis protein [Arachnia propionica]|uniref:MogA/MoaB family molybdenum cofactor biosynthesis protein n=1 Tax=Arachnia propionica TaxID=1750 RepID=A0A3P1T2I6_9ACTN|nr:MogA/MoaB family molybdenum cofactor biosynthesis protein [Arachnia propionica]RRD03468.1 MogA/MoaB family molybdenum cofactor biosynthesis protein [Arachnia propionica]
MTRAAVITCSDRAAHDVYEDRSGPILRDALAGLGFEVAEPVIVPDDRELIRGAVLAAQRDGARIICTTGGTGISPTDVTVEALRDLITHEIPGLMEEVRRLGAQKEPRALLSRGIAGVMETEPRCVVINAPGSRGGARDTIDVIGPLLHHLVEQLDGADHDLDRPASG